MKKNVIKAGILAILIPIILLVGCANTPVYNTDGDTDISYKNKKPNVSVWVAYWDLDNAKSNIINMQDDIMGISYFAAYFDKNNDLFIPEELTAFKEELISEVDNDQWDYYLTIVNDKTLGDSSLLKDTDLLRSLFIDETTMGSHINQIINLAIDGGYDGIDIDYEAIRTDIDLWERFIVFCDLLIQATEASGLKLRIILEPNAPIDILSFPEGPEYVMMCYNLYGTDTKKGPKANDEFLREMLKKMESLPGEKCFALATGGYHWKGTSRGRSITEATALELIESSSAKVYRSEDSGALTFQYHDEEGIENTVWYADAETITRWRNVILSDSDHNIMIWRIE